MVVTVKGDSAKLGPWWEGSDPHSTLALGIGWKLYSHVMSIRAALSVWKGERERRESASGLGVPLGCHGLSRQRWLRRQESKGSGAAQGARRGARMRSGVSRKAKRPPPRCSAAWAASGGTGCGCSVGTPGQGGCGRRRSRCLGGVGHACRQCLVEAGRVHVAKDIECEGLSVHGPTRRVLRKTAQGTGKVINRAPPEWVGGLGPPANVGRALSI